MRGGLNDAGWVIVTGLGEGPRAQKYARKSTQTLHRELKGFLHVIHIGRPFRVGKVQKPISHPAYSKAHRYTAFPGKETNDEKNTF